MSRTPSWRCQTSSTQTAYHGRRKMQPKCQICGRFISEVELWNCDSIECCEKHGFIKICGPCLEYWERAIAKKLAKPQDCVIETVRSFRKSLKSDTYPQYACPCCPYQSHSFEATAKHMAAKNHLYQGVGTYPIFVQGSETDPLNQNLPRREEGE